METTHQTNYDIFMENFSKKFDEEVKPLYGNGPIYTNLVMEALHAYIDGEWNKFMERTKQRYEEMEKYGL